MKNQQNDPLLEKAKDSDSPLLKKYIHDGEIDYEALSALEDEVAKFMDEEISNEAVELSTTDKNQERPLAMSFFA